MNFLCVGVNPAFDVTLTVDGLSSDKVNLVTGESREAAGKAVNVARELITLGCRCELALMLGRDNSGEFLFRLGGDIPTRIHLLEGATRENLTLLAGGDTIKINRRGVDITRADVLAFADILPSDMTGTAAVFSGSMPSGMSGEDYLWLMEETVRRGAMPVVDTVALSREQVLRLHPWIYKPNEHELTQLCGRKDMMEEELIDAAGELARKGVGIVLLTLGSRGLAVVTASETVRIDAVPVRAVNTVGAGDCALAGFIAAIARGCELPACGQAAAEAGARRVSGVY